MSIHFKLIVASLFFAVAATVFAMFSHQTQLASYELTRDLYEEGVDPLTRLQNAQATVAQIRTAFSVTLNQPAVNLSRPLGEGEALSFSEAVDSALVDLRGVSTMPISDETRQRLAEPLYLLDVLNGSRGRLSGRMALRELSRVNVGLENVASGLHGELAALRSKAARQADDATRRNLLGLAAVLVVGLGIALFVAHTVARSLKGVSRMARSLAEPSPEQIETPVSSPTEIRELVEALRHLQEFQRSREEEKATQVGRISSRLADTHAQLECALDNMTQALCMLDGQKRLVVANPEFRKLFGEVAVGTPARDFFPDSQLYRTLQREEMASQLLRTADGEIMEVKRRGMANEGLLITFDNITERQRESERLVYLAGYDTLTDLPNRRSFGDGVNALLDRGRVPFAVIVCELVGIKTINDTYGHAFGDKLLKLCAERIQTVIGPKGTTARLGGDEFAVLQPNVRSPEEAEGHAQRIRDAFAEVFDVDGRRIVIGISMGIVHVSETDRAQGLTADRLIQDCDLALYQSRGSQPSSFRLFQPAMRERLDQRRGMELDLERALRENQFELFYQPFIDTKTRRISGFEALMRWRQPERGFVSPAIFIPLAEEVGLIEKLGIFAIETACRQAAFWPRDLTISVNLSPVQFKSPSLVEDVRRALKESGIQASRLHIEVTESIFLDESDRVLATLEAFRRMGLQISMDDFGTGYSSLGYLSRFPFDRLKIDQSFVRNIDRAENLAIIRAIIGLSKALGLEIIAEGVETAQQMRILHAEGCRDMQGYFFSPPRPASDLAAMMAEIEAQWTAKFQPALEGRRAARASA